jgi:3-oxoacyl-[acyl-carrier-protein] synthase-1
LKPFRGIEKLARMACVAIEQALAGAASEYAPTVPLLLCVAESSRAGRLEDLDQQLFARIESLLNVRFNSRSEVIPQGRIAFGVALRRASEMISSQEASDVLICGADSLIHWPTLEQYEDSGRLLSAENSNGFIPGEASGCVIVARRSAQKPNLTIAGIGLSQEAASIHTEEPLRGDGLTRAVKSALEDARCPLDSLDFRITDLSGEHYYFKEAALALARCLHVRKEEFDLWHPAECIGETGSAIGPIMIGVAEAAARKGYAPGPGILCHAGNDDGERAAIVMRSRGIDE